MRFSTLIVPILMGLVMSVPPLIWADTSAGTASSQAVPLNPSADANSNSIKLYPTERKHIVINDMDVFVRPVSYISYKVRSNDGNSHNVKVFLGASTDIAVNRPTQEVSAETYINGKMSILKAGTIEQPVLKKKGDDLRID